jgi:hypothetical protein
MVATAKKLAPQFRQGQQVRFIGGAGTIKSLRPDAGSWTYQVEMEMGPEPEMGRIGYETTIVLAEADMTIAEHPWYQTLAIA